jgi:nicotinic acid mononucleotide adenylyltransferase
MSIDYNDNNTFIFSFVRMNPPTPGHLLVVESMINVALKLNVNKIYVILSNSIDDKNPIPCSRDTIPKPKTKKIEILISSNPIDYVYKSGILEDMVESHKRKMIAISPSEEEKSKISIMNIEIICSSGNPFSFINSVIYTNFIEKGITNINLFFIVGEDRAEFVDRIVKTYETNNYIKSINTKILPREGMQQLIHAGPGDTAIQDIPLQQFSASFVRKLVKNGKKSEFNEVYRPYLDQSQINQLYNTIENGLFIYNNNTTSKTKTEETPESYYVKNNLLPIIKGGKNKNKKTMKQKKRKNQTKCKKSKKQKKSKKTRRSKKN